MTTCGKVEKPILCATKGCDFYGTPSNYNLCSQCYKAFLKKEEAKIVAAFLKKEAKNNTSSLTIHGDSQGTTEHVDSMMKINQRCMVCKKKMGLIGFSCRCEGGVFCEVHRYPEEHACTFDFKSVGRVTLAKENPLCKGDKLETRI